jgi:uncharacterized protein YndB with AHSA1/START domain
MPRTDRASRVIGAPVARVFHALLDREALEVWLPPSGMTARFERFDPTPGGSYLTWAVEPVDGGTRVEITADDVPDGISADDHAAGMTSSLDNLASYLASHPSA